MLGGDAAVSTVLTFLVPMVFNLSLHQSHWKTSTTVELKLRLLGATHHCLIQQAWGEDQGCAKFRISQVNLMLLAGN